MECTIHVVAFPGQWYSTAQLRSVVVDKGIKARTSIYIPQYLWGKITSPCPWYLLLTQNSSIVRKTAVQWVYRTSCNIGGKGYNNACCRVLSPVSQLSESIHWYHCAFKRSWCCQLNVVNLYPCADYSFAPGNVLRGRSWLNRNWYAILS